MFAFVIWILSPLKITGKSPIRERYNVGSDARLRFVQLNSLFH